MGKNKEKTILERHEIAKRIGEVMPPWDFYRLFSTSCKTVQIWGIRLA